MATGNSPTMGRIFPNLRPSNTGLKQNNGVNLNDPLFAHLGRSGIGSMELMHGHNTTTRKNPMRDRVGKKDTATHAARAPSATVSNRPQDAKASGQSTGKTRGAGMGAVNPRKHTADTDADAPGTRQRAGDTKKTGTYKGKSNELGHGGRAQQLKDKGVPGGVIGAIARRKGAAPGGPNYHGGK